jgi:hypothetical protein
MAIVTPTGCHGNNFCSGQRRLKAFYFGPDIFLPSAIKIETAFCVRMRTLFVRE